MHCIGTTSNAHGRGVHWHAAQCTQRIATPISHVTRPCRAPALSVNMGDSSPFINRNLRHLPNASSHPEPCSGNPPAAASGTFNCSSTTPFGKTCNGTCRAGFTGSFYSTCGVLANGSTIPGAWGPVSGSGCSGEEADIGAHIKIHIVALSQGN